MKKNKFPEQTEHKNNETEEAKRSKKLEEIYKKLMTEYQELIKRLE